MENEQLRIPNFEPKDETAHFVVRGLEISLSHEKLKRQEAIEMFLRWYPDAEVLPSELTEAPEKT